jgi:[protein-PII] uridylyltransferase
VNESRVQLQSLQDGLAARFWQNDPIEALMLDLSNGIDAIIAKLFDKHLGHTPKVALYAVGGYGRQELHPGSDIDLLVLAAKPQKHQRAIELFLQSVFDLNVEVGHSVRDPKSCRSEAKLDITVATALFERRFITGDESIVPELDKAMASARLWPADKFFAAKYDEQQQRHKHYDNIEYNLEPNIKTSPGGLRDIHTALWICKRKFDTTDPQKLVDLGVLTSTEMRWLEEGKRFIWWVRFGLHLIAGRKEDRLQFGYQRELAERLGFVDTDAQRGVERFMHHYYRHVLALTEVNDILIQYFQEATVPHRKTKKEPINERFQITNNYIETTKPQVFADTPAALLEMFVIMANRNDIAGVRAATIRLVRDSLHLIDDSYRNNPEHTKLFIELLKAPYTLVSQLTRMRRYGVLGRYIPEFGKIIGQMQHDLFHIYTVDAHTMMVIRNMRRFRYRASQKTYPVAYHCVHTIPKLELLYIAGLYHDIGKGRGGDHSELGAVDTAEFCTRHGLNDADTELVCWLVKKHLYMSSVSQRQDIYDPDVVQNFAEEMKSEMRLDYLYALTVADINATNPTLWNSWRATLLRHLYNETRKMLRHGFESLAGRAATVAAYKERALERLNSAHADLPDEDILRVWANLGEDFFLRHTPPQIADLTYSLTHHDVASGPFVAIHDTRGDVPGEGATQIYIYSNDHPQLFAASVLALSRFELSVVDATVSTSDSNICFDTYTVLDNSGQPLPRDSQLREQIQSQLREVIGAGANLQELPQRLLPRRLRELPRPTEVRILPMADGKASTMTILASDRPGLLATIGMLFVELDLRLLSAKITTLGERVEDTFIIQTVDAGAVDDGETTYTLENTIRQRLDRMVGTRSLA